MEITTSNCYFLSFTFDKIARTDQEVWFGQPREGEREGTDTPRPREQSGQVAGLSFLAQIVPSVLSRENIDRRDVKLSLISDNNCQSVSEVRSGLG